MSTSSCRLLPLLLMLLLTAVEPATPTAGADERACVYRYGGGGECIDLTVRCQGFCSSDQVCGLDLNKKLTCFPASVRNLQNCRSEAFRLSQPCPADSGIKGFGQGCTFCGGGSSFRPRLRPIPSRSIPERACLVVYTGEGNFKQECIEISQQCNEKSCPTNTVCGLDLNERIECFPLSAKEFQNCGSEQFRLSQPCPADAGITGFGQGCTFCVGGNPFERPLDLLPGDLPTPGSSEHACVVIHIADGTFKRECIDISQQCNEKNCPNETVCGLNLDEDIVCFPLSVKDFQNCGPEEFRLSQPCPADAGIRGFGQGCTFCEGSLPTPMTTPAPSEPAVERACLVVHTGQGHFKEECVDIYQQCVENNCPDSTVCGLNLSEQIECFPLSVKEFENCGSEDFRLSQPCPADAGIRGFGAGCTFCVGGNPFEPPATTPRPVTRPTVSNGGRACINRHLGNGRFRRGCLDIRAQCARLACPLSSVCALNVVERPTCFPLASLGTRHCTPERMRVLQPCPPNTVLQAYGSGCNFCQRARVPPVTSTPARRKRACIVTRQVRECRDLTAVCARLRCGRQTVCALDTALRPRCVPLSTLPVRLRNCGSEHQRLTRPCPRGTRPQAFAQGCTACQPVTQPQTGAKVCLPRRTPYIGHSRAHPWGATSRPYSRIMGHRIPPWETTSWPSSYCFSITTWCPQKRCAGHFECGLDLHLNLNCYPKALRPKAFRFCGTEAERTQSPCGPARTPGFLSYYAKGCNVCIRR